jgi:phosphatidylglycerol:prolipoprotein diacylglycerol transferase
VWLNDFYHSLNPIAFTLGSFQVRWYGIAYLAGFVCAGLVIARVARRWKLDLTADDVLSVMIDVAVGVIVGARIFYVVFYGAGYYLEHPLEIFALNQGGMSFHGGLVGALVGGTIACKRWRLSVLTVADLAAIGAPIGLFFGRCANFVNGELWGKETSLPWGVMFPSGGAVYRHPSQLYEALLEGVVLLCVLFALSRHRPARPHHLLDYVDVVLEIRVNGDRNVAAAIERVHETRVEGALVPFVVGELDAGEDVIALMKRGDDVPR